MAYQKGPLFLKKDLLAEKLEKLNFELLRFGYWQQDDTPDLKNDILSNYKLVCITQGTCKVCFHKTEYFLQAGDSIIIAPFIVYTAICTSSEPVVFYDFHFQLSTVHGQAAFLALLQCEKMAIFPASIPPQAVPMLHLSYENMLAQKPGFYYSTKLSFLRTLLNLLTSQPDYQQLHQTAHSAPRKEFVVGQCTMYLKNNSERAVTVEELCQTMHVSQSYLYQSFISITGLSTKEFIITYKLKMVEVELKHTGRSIQDIAEALGFSSVYALSTQFKKYYGISPLRYRKRNET